MGKRYGIVILGTAAALVCLRLGLWQLERLGSQRALERERQVRLSQPVVRIDSLPAGALADTSLAGRPAAAHGVFDFARQILVIGRSLDGIPSVYVTTPLLLVDGRALLVERGAAYSPDSRTLDLGTFGEPDTAEVRGLLVAPRASRWRRVAGEPWPVHAGSNDPTQFSDQYPYPVFRLVLRRAVSPPGAPRGLRPVPQPSLGDGPHLSYAIQWFAFALIAMVGSVALYRKAASGER